MIKNLETELEKVKSNIENATSKMKEKEIELKNIEKKIHTLTDDYDELMSKSETISEDMKTLEEEREELKKQSNDIIVKTKEEKTSIEGEISLKIIYINKTIEELETAKKELEEIHKKPIKIIIPDAILQS